MVANRNPITTKQTLNTAKSSAVYLLAPWSRPWSIFIGIGERIKNAVLLWGREMFEVIFPMSFFDIDNPPPISS
jgi:hypothetical protein